MRKRIRLAYVLAAAFVIAAAGMMTMNRLDQEILVRQDEAREVRLRQLEVEARNSDMKQEIAQKDKDSYIMDMARRYYGYLLPGEIRFVVVNPESLYDEEEPEAEIIDDAVMREAGEGV
ncbi:MAG: septum formation initiator family protein [Clostridia bacterium]|nr:septum formation initiator family protein [Clostridia bacterium]